MTALFLRTVPETKSKTKLNNCQKFTTQIIIVLFKYLVRYANIISDKFTFNKKKQPTVETAFHYMVPTHREKHKYSISAKPVKTYNGVTLMTFSTANTSIPGTTTELLFTFLIS